MTSRRGLALAGTLAGCLVVLSVLVGSAESRTSTRATAPRPNVVVVMTDDQTAEMMRALPKVNTYIGQRGVTFANSYASFPLCCPSRATELTGQYAFNHGVQDVQPPRGGFGRLDGSNTLPVWLQSAGYYTAHIGKYLNGYGVEAPPTVPPGWSEWHGSIDPWTYVMYGYKLYEGGHSVTYGGPNQPAQYQTDVYSQKAADIIRQRAPSAQPFFLNVAVLAPHAENGIVGFPNPRAAPRHVGAFLSDAGINTPAIDEADVSDKPSYIQNRPFLSSDQRNGLQAYYRSQLASLLAVDDLVENLVNTLSSVGELDNTVIIFTSDNGQLVGEHRLFGKDRVYEESIGVPLVIRGPGIPAGVTRTQEVANIDLAPTILDFAGGTAGRQVDGMSLRPLAADPLLEPGRAIYLEGTEFNAVHTDRYVYVDNPGGPSQSELYDLRADPFQLNNISGNPRVEGPVHDLQRLEAQLQSCNGNGCRRKPKINLKCKRSKSATITGKQSRRVTRTKFYVGNRRVGRDRKRPFALNLRRARGKGARLTAIASMRDGRLVTLRKRRKGACR